MSHEAPRSAIVSSAAGTDISSLRTFLEILLGNGPECYALPRMCYHIDGKVPADEVPELTPPDQSPRNHANYLREKAARL